MPRERLLGHRDLDTREWEDGILTAAARLVVKEPENVHSWIICDGDVDLSRLSRLIPSWTTTTCERIDFGPNMNFVFETHDLLLASPAAISRMEMIFLDVAIGASGRLLYQFRQVQVLLTREMH
ncbi:hypothetical protein F442_07177 [Phytophthora nicotianae P10297]|uniref:Uncharacterized protein n=1 Tax=Phytophthora nicotianae P10297 TaxID=1317064 RepID=W2ZHZ4_PHYNI|nr:hypothetical protein F442_07177 [Phytophthora nicotianae P10297]